MTPRRGSSQVEVAGIKFSVDILKNRVELRAVRFNEVKIDEIIEQLNHVYGEGIDIRKRRAGKCAKVISLG
ncbi:hypothetical protein [Vulcanisaeta distributa]|uniref:Uncharacterized protein n=1 Tax=Vulcanisaeta distributa (strain DSM 14429 / JCM 11212 / NBRC 100878 / IC-017) TaxID=572478 RepID=E1QPT6_VULDI|nr:hypothetical protein [Vulcanisaeta distributa]ADN51496.1 hypothetical protein Vdis_2127 [Vulcanisaeta distributa DSM 14429]